MSFSYFLGVLLFALSLRVRAPQMRWPAFSQARATALAAALATGLVAVFACEMRFLDRAAQTQAMPAWQASLPLAIFYHNGLYGMRDPGAVVAGAEAFAVAETALLAGLWGVLRRVDVFRPALTAVILTGAAALGWIALHAALSGPDVYAYAGDGLLANPYRPDAASLAHLDLRIREVWGPRFPPSPYGPLWNAVAHGIDVLGGSLEGRLLGFRLAGAAALGACAIALARARKPLAAALLALDPAFWHAYVAEAHNDVLGVALVLAAVAVRGRPAVAVVLVALAGLVKLPFILIGAVAFAGGATPRARVFLACAAAAAALAASAIFGGADYAWALRRTVELYPIVLSPADVTVHAALVAVALGAAAAALFAGRFFWGAAWSPLALAQFTCLQYLGWCVPYAICDETAGALFLATFPLAAWQISLVFNTSLGYDVTRVVLLVVLVAAISRSILRRPPAARAAEAA